MKRQGFFITFEGPEGSGKSTQARLLAQFLRRRGYRVLMTHEPGGTALGAAVRQILLHVKTRRLTPVTEMALFMASRVQLVDEVILPALQRGDVVICDRFLDSTLAYQGGGSGISLATIRALGRLVTRGVAPDLTFLLDLPIAIGFQRLGRARDRMETKARAYHARVRRQYLALADAEPRRMICLDARQPVIQLQRVIQALVLRRLQRRRMR